MIKPVLLQNSVHGDLRIDSTVQGGIYEKMRNVSVIIQEFQHLALNYPIILTKNQETGAFSCVALFGFEEGENLCVTDGEWDALYVPLNVVRGPFLLGTQKVEGQGENDVEHVLLIDMDDPRVQKSKGELLFNDRGFPTPYLERVTSIVRTLKDGLRDTEAFVAELLELDLISPAKLKIEFADGEHREVIGLYTIDPERLKGLHESQLAHLHGKGYLEAVYAMQVSFGHIRTLIDKKNKRL